MQPSEHPWRADHQTSGRLHELAGGLALHFVHLRQDTARVRYVASAGVSQGQATRRTDQQYGTQLPFQLADLAGQRRDRQAAQPRSG
nr:hypothetical protein [Lysobacter sp.]